MPQQYQAYPQTSYSTQAYSGQSSQNSLTTADLTLAQGITTAAGLASLAEIPSNEIQASKSVLNALAVDYEEKILHLTNMVEQMAPHVEQAAQLRALWTDEGFASLCGLFNQVLTTKQGAYDYFIATDFSNIAAAFADASRAQRQQQQQQAQQAQGSQEMPEVLPISYVANAAQQAQQQRNIPESYWSDGRQPERNELRPAFATMPNPSGQRTPQVDLEGIPMSQMWEAVDIISGRGGFRGTTLASE